MNSDPESPAMEELASTAPWSDSLERNDYNTERPIRSINRQTPAELKTAVFDKTKGT